ncbi:MAG: hypothetical protein QOG52_2286 [Frankiaceae bacterium]|nr:hypothetical protein [Frankiaceae bacterium]
MTTPESVYTNGHHPSVLASHRWRTAVNSAAYLLPHLHSGATLLDVGCGPGTITADIARLVAPARVTAIEISEEALDLGRDEAARQGVTTIDFAVGDVHDLQFADDTFVVVHAHQVLQHVPDPGQALREMRRVCRPGGIVAARDSDYATFTWWPPLPELDEWRDLYTSLARSNGGEPDAGRRLLSWAQQAGFEEVVATSSTWCFATPEDRLWWGSMWAARITQSGIAKQAVQSGATDAAGLARIADGWRRWAAADDGWLSILHGEILATA